LFQISQEFSCPSCEQVTYADWLPLVKQLKHSEVRTGFFDTLRTRNLIIEFKNKINLIISLYYVFSKLNLQRARFFNVILFHPLMQV
jgi:hypothetical protein